MKFSTLALTSALALGTAAELHAGHHGHLHARHGSPVEVRDPAAVVETVAGPVVTIYELNGHDIPFSQVQAGMKDGKYVLIPPSSSAAPPTTTTTVAPTTSPVAAEFFQVSTTTTTTSVVPTTTTTVAPTTTTTVAPPPTTTTTTTSAAAPVSTSAGGNVDADFPSGTIPCSQFPSEYGAVAVDWMGLEGWTGVQNVPNFNFGLDTAISYIETAISGSSCTAKSFCSYACPAGYQKSQWPTAQGNTGQSIGGLYCNANGMLELSQTSTKQICIPGTGGVKVKNSLSTNVCICRTDYPGTESETIPLDALPGGTYPLTCPDANTYYKWEGSDTSAQYYINPSNNPCSEACTWGTAGTNLGNWAPVNAGVGRGTDGNTYISLFPNAPTNPDGKLDFKITITGGTTTCTYSDGSYFNNGVESATGCTVSLKPKLYLLIDPNNTTGCILGHRWCHF